MANFHCIPFSAENSRNFFGVPSSDDFFQLSLCSYKLGSVVTYDEAGLSSPGKESSEYLDKLHR